MTSTTTDKINIQLIPCSSRATDYITTIVQCNPKLQLITNKSKLLNCVFTHLNKKWGQSNTQYINIINSIRLVPISQPTHTGYTFNDRSVSLQQLMKLYCITSNLLIFHYKFDLLECSNNNNLPQPAQPPLLASLLNTVDHTMPSNKPFIHTQPTNNSNSNRAVQQQHTTQYNNNNNTQRDHQAPQQQAQPSLVHTNDSPSEFAIPNTKPVIHYDESLGWLNELSLHGNTIINNKSLTSTPLIKQYSTISHTSNNDGVPYNIPISPIVPCNNNEHSINQFIVPTPVRHTQPSPAQSSIQPFNLMHNLSHNVRRSQLIADSDSELSQAGHSRHESISMNTPQRNNEVQHTSITANIPAINQIINTNTTQSSGSHSSSSSNISTAHNTSNNKIKSAVDMWHCSNTNCTKTFKKSSRNAINKHVHSCQYNIKKVIITNSHNDTAANNHNHVIRSVLNPTHLSSPVTRSMSNGIVRTVSNPHSTTNTPNKSKRLNDTMRQLQWYGGTNTMNSAINHELCHTNINVVPPPTPGKQIIVPQHNNHNMSSSHHSTHKKRQRSPNTTQQHNHSNDKSNHAKRQRKPTNKKSLVTVKSIETASSRIQTRRMSDGLMNWANNLVQELSSSNENTPIIQQQQFTADSPNLLLDDDSVSHNNQQNGYNIGNDLLLDQNSAQYQQFIV